MHISSNIRKLTLFFVALFIALSAGLVYWQVIVAQQVTANPHNGRPCLTTNAPVRGRIFDRNGTLLAQSIPDQNAPCGYVRKYIDPSLAGIIGYYAGPNFPSTGLERAYNSFLNGSEGLTSLNNIVNKTLHRSPVGDDLYLTIDERIQQLVNKHFDDPVTIVAGETFATDRGSVIVSDPHSGEILAMLSRPSYDPNKLVDTLSHGDLSYYNQLVKDPQQPLLERPIQQTYIPGSIYKTVTLVAGLDSGKATLNQQFTQQQARGPIFYNGQAIGPNGNNIDGYTIHFPVDTEYGYTHSDNIIFAQVGVETGFDTWLDYNKRFYVGQDIPFDLPVVKSNVLKNGQSLQNNELAANAFGQGYDSVTPFQMSLIDNAVANDGQLMQPTLISKILDQNKTPVMTTTFKPLGPTQMSSSTATQVRQAMFGVVRCGSGSIVSQLFTSTAGIIGKTGTAELGNNVPAHSWMITQAPYSVSNPTQLPALTIVAMKENGGEGGATVGPMIAAIYNEIFANNYVKVQTPPAPATNYCCQTGLLQIGCGNGG
jgi:cell division protein FtsI/penicillin-binding protein 2